MKKKFILKSAIWAGIPFFLFLLAEWMTPQTTYTFRIWEAVKASKELYVGPFYPNQKVTMVEDGDLTHHTPYSIKKEILWETDQLGFRNTKFIKNPDIVLIGDSNIVGSSLDQDETLASVLSAQTGEKAYSLAPAKLKTFIALKNEKLIEAPKLIVISSIERNISSLSSVKKRADIDNAFFKLNPVAQKITIAGDKLLRRNSIRFIKARIKKSKGLGVQSEIDPNLFFFQGPTAGVQSTDALIEHLCKRMNEYEAYCESIGAKFLFLPIPDKETIFWKEAGLEKQPDFLDILTTALQKEDLPVIDTKTLFEKMVEEGTLPYHKDDTHWNLNGVQAAADEIESYLSN